MKNVEMTVEGETLIIRVDLSKDFGKSKSGKTIIVASTEGNVSVPERDEKIGLNIYRYPDWAFIFTQLQEPNEKKDTFFQKSILRCPGS